MRNWRAGGQGQRLGKGWKRPGDKSLPLPIRAGRSAPPTVLCDFGNANKEANPPCNGENPCSEEVLLLVIRAHPNLDMAATEELLMPA